jgi:hypothetical protein
MFEFGPGFPFKFLAGSLNYWLDAFDAPRQVQAYVDDDRSVWIQELNLTQPQIDALIDNVERNRLPEAKYYAYDSSLDNCSTRVRDAIDKVLDGQIKAHLEPRATGTTYRWHTRRLMADDWVTDLAIAYVEGPYVDRGINQWQESFLPVKLMEHLRDVKLPDGTSLVRSERQLHESRTYFERSAPPGRVVPYLIAGAIGGAAMYGLGRARNKWARRGGFFLIVMWCVIGGIGSLILLYAWFFTRHLPPDWNRNLWQLNPLMLAILVLLPRRSRSERVSRLVTLIALAVVALGGVGVAIKLLPIQHQANADLIALCLTMNLGLVAALYRPLKLPPAAVAGAKLADRPIMSSP